MKTENTPNELTAEGFYKSKGGELSNAHFVKKQLQENQTKSGLNQFAGIQEIKQLD